MPELVRNVCVHARVSAQCQSVRMHARVSAQCACMPELVRNVCMPELVRNVHACQS